MDQKKTKVSLIITVFNRAGTLERCLNSALNQTLSDVEIVVVDDGSTDGSVSIIKTYEKKYAQVVFVNYSENRGPGYAKNRGVEAAGGEYISFLDSDDYLDPDYLEGLYSALLTTGSDMAVGDLIMESKDQKIASLSQGSLVLEKMKLAPIPVEGLSLVSGLVVAGFWGGASACTKLIKKDLLCEFPFYEGKQLADCSSILPSLATAKQIVYVPQCRYHYTQSKLSVERTLDLQKSCDAMTAIVQTISIYRNNNVKEDFPQILVANSLLKIIATAFSTFEVKKNPELISKLISLWNTGESALLDEKKNPYIKLVMSYMTTIEDQLAYELLPLFAKGQNTQLIKELERIHKNNGDAYPKVSIVIPVYNGSNYMCDAIDSALAQTYKNIEVIVVNDGSCDNGMTEKIALSYGERIRYFSKPNGGVATALNYGIEKMTGEYFSWLSHDDMYEPNKIENELKWLALRSDRTEIVAEGYKVVDANGKYMYTVNLHETYSSDSLNNGLFCVLRGGINGCAMLIHKSHFARVGSFDPSLPTTQDYDLWFRMLRGQKINYLNTSNVLSRCHDEQGSKTILSDHVIECDNLWIGMMNAVTEQERMDVSKSSYCFYKELWEFLRGATGYNGAMAYAKRMMANEALLEYEREGDAKMLEVAGEASGVSGDFIKKSVLPYRTLNKNKARLFFQLGERNDGGGLNKIVVQTASELSSTHDVIIGACGEPYKDGYKSCDSVTELCFDYYSPENYEQYGCLLYLLQIDIYITSYCCIPNSLQLLSAIRKNGIKTIAWSHEDYFLPYWRSSLWNSLPARNKYLPQSDAVIWINSGSLAMYGMQHNNGVYIPNQTTIKKSECARRNSKRLIAIGRFDDAVKNLGDLLQAFSSVVKHHSDAELYVIGTADLQLPIKGKNGMTCQQFIGRSGLSENNLHFIEWTDDIAKYYQLGTLHIMPSLYEGFGLVVLEAAAHGVPTVAYDGSGMADIISHGIDGVLVERSNWSKMADSITELLDRPEKIAAMQNALPEMLSRYQPDKISALWSNLIKTLLSDDLEAKKRFFEKENASDIKSETVALAIKEYEATILKLYSGQTLPEISDYDQGGIWRNECMLMQQSLSWRVTKPLRIIRSVITTFKRGGMSLLKKKVKKKLSSDS